VKPWRRCEQYVTGTAADVAGNTSDNDRERDQRSTRDRHPPLPARRRHRRTANRLVTTGPVTITGRVGVPAFGVAGSCVRPTGV